VPAPPPLPPVPCPGAEAFAPYLQDAGPPLAAKSEAPAKPGAKAKAAPAKRKGAKAPTRALRSACVEFAPGRFWLAALLTFEEGTGKNPRLGLVSGTTPTPSGPDARWMLFDVAPLPTESIEKLIASSAETAVQIRRTRNDTGLIRLGVTGGPGGGKPDRQEVGVLLQLVAHRPPRILWEGPGDQIATQPDGCVTESTVDFELLFRSRLERFTIGKVLPDANGKIAPTCKADPSMQESVGMNAVSLSPGRTFAGIAPEPADAAKPKAASPPG
jgi:hypothetical protein